MAGLLVYISLLFWATWLSRQGMDDELDMLTATSEAFSMKPKQNSELEIGLGRLRGPNMSKQVSTGLFDAMHWLSCSWVSWQRCLP